MFGGFDGSSDPQAWRRQWFDALSGNTDAYLRSPPFLRMMKAHIDALIQAKQSAASGDAGHRTMPPRASGPDADGQIDWATWNRRSSRAWSNSSSMSTPWRAGLPASQLADGWDRFSNALQVPPAAPDDDGGDAARGGVRGRLIAIAALLQRHRSSSPSRF